MQIKFLVDTDFTNYKKPSMFIGFPKCSFKCNRDYGKPICQNERLLCADNIEINEGEVVGRYLANPLSEALVIGGLEPFDTWEQLYSLISAFRISSDDDIVIYTGYYMSEIIDKINILKKYKNIIVKFGRYFPGDEPHFEEVLGVNLASDGQYAVRLECE